MPTLLLLIDLQRAFCDADGSIARQGRDIAPLAAAAAVSDRLAAAARTNGVAVAWTRMMLRPDYADGGTLLRMRPNLARVGALRAGTADVELSTALHVGESDVIIDKPRYSSIYATPLEALLRASRTDRVVVGGVTTSMCVETTVRDLSQRDFDVAVVEDACGDFDAARHAASLAAIAFGFAPVVSEAEALAMMAGA